MPDTAADGNKSISLALDVDKKRNEIRSSLHFHFVPLPGKGKPTDISLISVRHTQVVSVAQDFLVALWETNANRHSNTSLKYVEAILWFLRFLLDHVSQFSKNHNITLTSQIRFECIRDFEHWMRSRPRRSTADARREKQLADRLDNPLPITPDGFANLKKLSKDLRWKAEYFYKSQVLFGMVKNVAERAGAAMPPTPAELAEFAPKPDNINSKFVATNYYFLVKLISHMARNGVTFSPGFKVPALAGKELPSPVKTPALDGRERALLRKAAMRAARDVRKRLLIEAPKKIAEGTASPTGCATAWAENDANAMAYLASAWPGAVPPVGDHVWKIIRAAQDGPGRGRTAPIIFRHNPCVMDLIPFIILIGMNRHAPFNLGSILALNWSPDIPEEHCIHPSPSKGRARIMFSKATAGIDRDFLDVPDRGEFDIPGLIRSVAAITETVRQQLPPGDRTKPWAYLTARRGVRIMSGQYVADNLNRFVESIGLEPSDPSRKIHFRRFRPTVLAEVAASSGVERAQTIANHANPAQTIAYALNPTSSARLKKAVSKAQSKALVALTSGYASQPKKAEVTRMAMELDIPPGAALEILLGKRDKLYNACIDDRNGAGPEPAGRKCGSFEACLVCANSVILQRHLSRLISYQTHWYSQIGIMTADEWNDAHSLNCAIVDAHLTKFAPDVVAAARADAERSLLPIAYRRFHQS